MGHNKAQSQYQVSFEVSCPYSTPKDKLILRVDNEAWEKGSSLYRTLVTTDEAHPVWFTQVSQPILLDPKVKYSFFVRSSDGVSISREREPRVFSPGESSEDQELTLVLEFNITNQDKCVPTSQRQREYLDEWKFILKQPHNAKNSNTLLQRAKLAGVPHEYLEIEKKKAEEKNAEENKAEKKKVEVRTRLQAALSRERYVELVDSTAEAQLLGLSGEDVSAAQEKCKWLHRKFVTLWENIKISFSKDDIIAMNGGIKDLEFLGAYRDHIEHAKSLLVKKSLALMEKSHKDWDKVGLKENIQNAERVGVDKNHMIDAKKNLENMEALERIEHAALEMNVSEIDNEFEKAKSRLDLKAMEKARSMSLQIMDERAMAKEQIQHACEKSHRIDLKKAIANGRRAGLPNDDLDVAVKHLEQLDHRINDVVASISEGVDTKDFLKLQSAIHIAKNIDFHDDSLDYATRELQKISKQEIAKACDMPTQDSQGAVDAQHALKNAIEWCKQAGLNEEDYSHAMERLQHIEELLQRLAAETKLRHAVYSCDVNDLRTAIEWCKEVGVEGASVDSAVEIVDLVQKSGCDPAVTAEPDHEYECLSQARGTPMKRPPGKSEHCQASKTPRTERSHVSEGDGFDNVQDAEQGTVTSTTTTLDEQAEADTQYHAQQDDLGDTHSNKCANFSQSASTVQTSKCPRADDSPQDTAVQVRISGKMQQELPSVDPKPKGTEEKAHCDWVIIDDVVQTSISKQDSQAATHDQGCAAPTQQDAQRNHTDNSLVQDSVNDALPKSEKGATDISSGDTRSVVAENQSFYNTGHSHANPQLQQVMHPVNKSNGSSTCPSVCFQYNKAQPSYKWEVHAHRDTYMKGDVEQMSAANIARVKAYVEKMRYSGFCVFGGVAYIKHFSNQLERDHLTWMGLDSECVFYIAVQQANHSYAPSAIRNPGYIIDWQHCDATGHWQNFTRDVSAFVEQAYCEGSAKVSFYIESGNYEVDFYKMRQTNIFKDTLTRRVRRLFSPPEDWKFMWHPAVLHMRFESVRKSSASLHFGNDIHSDFNRLSKKYIDQLKRSKYDEALFFQIPVWRDMEDADSWLIIAAVSVALWTVSPRIKCPIILLYSAQDEAFKVSVQKLQLDLRSTKPSHGGIALPHRSGGYTWLRQAKDTESRWCRLASACSVLRMYSSQLLSTKRIPRCIDSMIKGTQLLAFEDLNLKLLPECRYQNTSIFFSNKPTLLEAALQADCDPCKVAVVNAASGYHVGGGFLTGGRHALEEALCMQSTLYFSLARAVELANDMHDGRGLLDHKCRPIHIPECGCLLSPDVEIVREGTDSGYACRPSITRLAAVLSIAMPNKNYHVVDSPVDHRNGKDYEDLVRKKFISIMVGAILAGADVLVVPDCGCGVFQNNPVHVGRLFKEVLELFDGHFEKVILVGSFKFAEAAGVAFSVTRENEWFFSNCASFIGL